MTILHTWVYISAQQEYNADIYNAQGGDLLARTHILFGAGLALAASQAAHLSVPATLMIVGSGAIGGLLPDIDHPGSTFGRR
ncbi:metal-dependent hydrolase, partial [Ferrovum sp.]|uniref:metal-dependent hydrolase n=1 Tax=Ferrovum sp. TaxID=2609467 RepID=UPI00345BEA8D